MNATADGSEPPGGQDFLAEQARFGRIVGGLRDRFPDRFAHAQVCYEPPSFLVRFVGGVPAGVEETLAELSYPVRLSGDGVTSEAELQGLQQRIWELLLAEGIANHMTAADTANGSVNVTIPVGFVPSSSALLDLLSDSRVLVTTTGLTVWKSQ